MLSFRKSAVLGMICCATIDASASPLRAGPEISEDDRAVVLMLSDAHRNYRTRPDSGYIRAQTVIPTVSGEMRKDVEVWWRGEHYRQIVLSHTTVSGELAERLGRTETHDRIVRISTPESRMEFQERTGDPDWPVVVSRGELPQFDPERGKTIEHVEPHNAWYKSGNVGKSIDVDELLVKLTRPEYRHRVTTSTSDDEITLRVHSDRDAGLTARFDLNKGARIVEIHSWSDESPSYSRLTRYAWVPDDVVDWRLARLEYGLGASSDAADERREWQTLTVSECEFGIDIPDDVFSFDQIATPKGTYIREYEPGAERPTKFVVGVEDSDDRVPQALLDRLGRELKESGFGSDEKKKK